MEELMDAKQQPQAFLPDSACYRLLRLEPIDWPIYQGRGFLH